MMYGRPLTIELSAREVLTITEVLRDAHDDPTRQWSQSWRDRVKPVRERFDDLQKLLNRADQLECELQITGVKLLEL